MRVPSQLREELLTPAAGFRTRFLRVFLFPREKYEPASAGKWEKLRDGFFQWLEELKWQDATRSIYSLYAKPEPSADDLAEALSKASPVPIWERAELPEGPYLDDYLPGVAGFAASRYYRLNPSLEKIWFGDGLEMTVPDVSLALPDAGSEGDEKHEKTDVLLQGQTVQGRSVELFISSTGVGVLSVQFGASEQPGLDIQRVAEFNYRMSRAKRRDRPRLCLPCGRGFNAERAAKVAALLAYPRPASVRFGVPLAVWGIDGLANCVLPGIEFEFPHQWMAATAVRFRREHAWSSGSGPARFEAAASRLAQLEESTHPGLSSGGVPNQLISNSHRAACSTLGAAHLCADQWPIGSEGRPQHFDASRLNDVHDGYFFTFLLALQQRFTLEWMHRAAAGLTPESASFNLVSRDASTFPIQAHLIHASYRDSKNRFYEMAQDAQDVRPLSESVARTLSDLERGHSARIQKENTTVIAETQRKVEWIELTILTVYTAEVLHIVLEMHFNGHSAAIWPVLGAMLAAFLGGLVVLNPGEWKWAHHLGVRRRLFVMVLVLGIIAALASLVFHHPPQKTQPAGQTSISEPPSTDPPKQEGTGPNATK